MKFQDYLPQHEELYPKPEREKVKRSWDFWLGAVSLASVTVLAALRTSHSFFIAAQLSAAQYGIEDAVLTGVMSYGEMTVSIMGIEGGLAWAAMKHAQRSKKVNPKTYKWYVSMLFTISMVAGLGQSLGLVNNLPISIVEGFQWVLAAVLGLVTSIVVVLAGEMMGGELQLFRDENKLSDQKLAREEKKWRKDALARWYQVRNEQQSAPTKPVPSAPQVPQADLDKEKVRQFVTRMTLKHRRTATPSEISSALGMSGPYVVQILEVLKREA